MGALEVDVKLNTMPVPMEGGDSVEPALTVQVEPGGTAVTSSRGEAWTPED